MKSIKLLVIGILQLVSIMLFSQNKFEYLLSSEFFKLPQQIIETKNHNYIFCSASLNDVFYTQFFSLTKISESGDLIKTKIMSELVNTTFTEMIINSDSTFLALGNNYNNADSIKFVVYCINNELEILWHKEYNNEDRIFGYIRSNRNKSGNIVFSARSDHFDNKNINLNYFNDLGNSRHLTDFGMILYELSNNGDSIKAKQFSEKSNEPYHIVEKPNCTGYYLFVAQNLSDELPYKSITEFDYEFNPIEDHYDPANVYLTFFTNARNLGKSKIIYTGYDNLPGSQYVGAVAVLDTFLHPIAKKQIIVPDTVVNLSHQYNLDFRNPNNIYVSGISNFIEIPYQMEPSWVILTNMDSSLNFRWQKFYGGDAFYFPWSTLATDDGGCIVLGYRWDFETPDYSKNEIFVMKVDSLGSLTTIYGPQISTQNIKVFPNPGKNYMNVSISPDVNANKIMLYNITGMLVLEYNMNFDFITINTSTLKPGIYFYKIYSGNQLINSGKWIIQ